MILNYPALIQWPMGGIHLTTKDLSFGQRSVSSDLRNLTSLLKKAFKKHIRGVDISSHVDNNSNCCDLCKF